MAGIQSDQDIPLSGHAARRLSNLRVAAIWWPLRSETELKQSLLSSKIVHMHRFKFLEISEFPHTVGVWVNCVTFFRYF